MHVQHSDPVVPLDLKSPPWCPGRPPPVRTPVTVSNCISTKSAAKTRFPDKVPSQALGGPKFGEGATVSDPGLSVHHVWRFPRGRGPGTFSKGMGYKPLEVTGDPPAAVVELQGALPSLGSPMPCSPHVQDNDLGVMCPSHSAVSEPQIQGRRHTRHPQQLCALEPGWERMPWASRWQRQVGWPTGLQGACLAPHRASLV